MQHIHVECSSLYLLDFVFKKMYREFQQKQREIRKTIGRPVLEKNSSKIVTILR